MTTLTLTSRSLKKMEGLVEIKNSNSCTGQEMFFEVKTVVSEEWFDDRKKILIFCKLLNWNIILIFFSFGGGGWGLVVGSGPTLAKSGTTM